MLERFLYTLIPLLGWRIAPVAQTTTLTRAIYLQATATLFKGSKVELLSAVSTFYAAQSSKFTALSLVASRPAHH